MNCFIPADQVIPPITDPLGSQWHQPKLIEILISETQAMMSRRALEQLPEYSASLPLGVYEGKMWRCSANQARDKWILRWYGPSDKPDRCSIHQREILL